MIGHSNVCSCTCVYIHMKLSKRKGTLPFNRPCGHVNAPYADCFKATLAVEKRAMIARRYQRLRNDASNPMYTSQPNRQSSSCLQRTTTCVCACVYTYMCVVSMDQSDGLIENFSRELFPQRHQCVCSCACYKFAMSIAFSSAF